VGAGRPGLPPRDQWICFGRSPPDGQLADGVTRSWKAYLFWLTLRNAGDLLIRAANRPPMRSGGAGLPQHLHRGITSLGYHGGLGSPGQPGWI